jgi:hypothetical protein
MSCSSEVRWVPFGSKCSFIYPKIAKRKTRQKTGF